MHPRTQENLRYYEELNTHWRGLEGRIETTIAIGGLWAFAITRDRMASPLEWSLFGIAIVCLVIATLLGLSALGLLQWHREQYYDCPASDGTGMSGRWG